MRQQERIRRIQHEIIVINNAFASPNDQSSWIQFDRRFRWMMIPQFTMPPHCSHNWSPFLLFLPPAYPMIPPLGFCISQDILRHNQPMGQAQVNGWTYFQITLETWRATADVASGYNLLTVLDRAYRLLNTVNGPNWRRNAA